MKAELIALDAIAPQPWKNGAGLTREIAASPAGGADFDWRISVAEVSRDAPFSAFPGVDRCIVLLRGAGMVLREHGGAWLHRLDETLQPFSFSGDDKLDARLIDGANSDLNVMVRRGRYRSEVAVVRETSTTAGAGAGLLLCCDGAWNVGGTRLFPTHALLWRNTMPPLQLEPEQDRSAAIVVRLCQDGAE